MRSRASASRSTPKSANGYIHAAPLASSGTRGTGAAVPDAVSRVPINHAIPCEEWLVRPSGPGPEPGGSLRTCIVACPKVN